MKIFDVISLDVISKSNFVDCFLLDCGRAVHPHHSGVGQRQWHRIRTRVSVLQEDSRKRVSSRRAISLFFVLSFLFTFIRLRLFLLFRRSGKSIAATVCVYPPGCVSVCGGHHWLEMVAVARWPISGICHSSGKRPVNNGALFAQLEFFPGAKFQPANQKISMIFFNQVRYPGH